jgi:5-methylcytosine-specific restriction endonuclease McrA
MSSNRPTNTRRYRQLRAIVLADSPLCVYCKRVRATQTDHWIPLALGGRDELSNLVPACWPCNRAKGAQMPDAFMNHSSADLVDPDDW